MRTQVHLTLGGEPFDPPTSGGIGLFQAMLAAPIVGLSPRWPRVYHAVESKEIASAWPNGTVTAVCGAKRLRLLASGPLVVEWPIGVKGLPEGRERCRACWEATGKKRPRSRFIKREE